MQKPFRSYVIIYLSVFEEKENGLKLAQDLTLLKAKIKQDTNSIEPLK
jgi:hypothetical protein